jgi:DNA-binding XRE family transcriptional regulator
MTSVINRNFEECFQVNVIGDNVKRLRKKHLLNQVEFAKIIGVSQGSLSDIEQGRLLYRFKRNLDVRLNGF